MSDAIRHELEEKVKIEQTAKLRAQFGEEKAKEMALRERKIREEFEKENKQRENDLKEARKKEQILLEKIASDEEERKKAEEKIREDAVKDSRLEKLELEKKLKDTQEALEDAQRKAKQSSQQLQGEVLELDLEEKLKATFPTDEFVPVPKGAEGADIWQKVVFKGKAVGSILWEIKRTKAWSNSWSAKLKDDAAKISATEAIIVSIVLPNGISNFDRRDGVWITTYEHSISICRYVRFLITTVARVKSSVGQTDEDWGQIRDYMMSDSFKHRMQAHFDGINSLRETLEAEKRATNIRWKKQEVQINKLDMNTANFYGELKAIVSNLPEISEIETPLIEGGDEEDDEGPTLF